MSVFVLIPACAALLQVFTTAMVWFHDRRNPLNHMAGYAFALFGVCFWCQHHQRGAASAEEAMVWLKAQAIVYPAIAYYVQFVARWIQPERRPPRALTALLWGSALSVMVLHGHYDAVGQVEWVPELSMWLVIRDPDSSLRLLVAVWIALVFVTYAGVVIAAMWHPEDEGVRHRARSMAMGVVAPTLITVTYDALLVLILDMRLPTINALSFGVGSAFVTRAVVKGHLFVMSAATTKALLSATSEAVLMTDHRGIIVDANPAMGRLMALEPESLHGERLLRFFPQVASTSSGDLQVLHGAETTLSSAPDVEIPVLMSMDPVRDSGGRLRGWICLLRDRTAQVAQSAQERAARLAAEEAARAKSAFLANMSHEIRTPMNGVIGMTSLLADTPLDEHQRELLSTIKSSGEVLLAVLNDILDLSKIEAGHLALEQIPFSVRDAVEQSLVLLGGQAAEKHIALGYTFEPDIPERVLGDPVRLRQVLVNLLSNAVKFTEAGSTSVHVRMLERSAPQVGRVCLEICVEDTGIGIAPSRVEHLFDPFTQADTSTTRRYGGTGLGLAICKQLVELMGGDIWVHSEVGAGSRFYFTYNMLMPPQVEAPRPDSPPVERLMVVSAQPTLQRFALQSCQRWGVEVSVAADLKTASLLASATSAPPQAILSDLPEHVCVELSHIAPLIRLCLPSEVEREPLDGASSRVTQPIRYAALRRALWRVADPDNVPGQTPTTPKPKVLDAPLRVLVVEDHPVNQKVAQRMLARMGLQVDLAPHGEAGLEAVSARPYDVVLMDVQMPVMDGLEATRQIRERGFDELYIVAMTANATALDRRACLDAGMDHYLSKPIQAKELRLVLQALSERLGRGAESEEGAARSGGR